MPKPKGPTLTEVAAEIAATLDGAVTFDEFAQRVLAIRPSAGKHPLTQTKSALRDELERIGLTFADCAHKLVTPIRSVLNGLTVRHVFDAQEIATRQLYLRDAELILLPKASNLYSETFQRFRLVDAKGMEVKAKPQFVSTQVEGLLGSYTVEAPTLHLPRWLMDHAVKAGDAALLTILDHAALRWQIVHEPAAQRRQSEIEAANRTLADLLFEQLELAQDERIALYETLLTAFAQLSPTQRAYPGDPWTTVIQRDGRMRHNGFQLMYAEDRSPLESMLEDLQEELAPAPTPTALTPDQERTIYRCKIHPTYNKKLWRRIEVLGRQTLRELNGFLVDEFKHDWDHMGGFWRLVPRGAGKRVREMEIAQISPFVDEEDVGAELRIAELGLEPGDRLRWVYDFGDWHEYDLLIEDVEDAPAIDADYPRVVARNKP